LSIVLSEVGPTVEVIDTVSRLPLRLKVTLPWLAIRRAISRVEVG